MPRNSKIPKADGQNLYYSDQDNEEEVIEIGSERWFEWLEENKTQSFSFEGYHGHKLTARKEKKMGGKYWYWYAYRWLNGKVNKAYLGASRNLTREKLNQTAAELSQPQLALPI
jgi:hypothetical protein